MKKSIFFILLSLSLFSCDKENLATNDFNDVQELKNFSTDTLEPKWGKKVTILPKFKNTKNVTLLSYLAFDNSKDFGRWEMFPVLNMHELAGTNDKLNQLVFADGAHNMPSRTYLIENDKSNENIKSSYVLESSNLDSGNYLTLQNFIKKGFTDYPSKIKILDINSHGEAYLGIAPDITSKTKITMPNLAKAIKNSVGKVNMINFDACLMSSIEVAYEFKSLSDIIIASEDNTLETGMGYIKHFPEIINKSGDNLEKMAENILSKSETIGVTYQSVENGTAKDGLEMPKVFTISAIRTKSMDKLAYNLNQLSRMFLNKIDIYKPVIKKAFDKSHKFTINGIEESDDIGQRDAYEVFGRLEVEIRHAEEDRLIKKDNEINNYVTKVRENLREIAIRSDIHKTEPWAEGISINIFSKYMKNKEYQEMSFAKDNLWDELVNKIN